MVQFGEGGIDTPAGADRSTFAAAFPRHRRRREHAGVSKSLCVQTRSAHGEDECLHGVVMRRLISSGSSFERDIGYSRAVVDGDWVFVSGTTGFDYGTMTISDNVVEQAEQCLRNIGHALAEAECSFSDVVRVRYILPRVEDFE